MSYLDLDGMKWFQIRSVEGVQGVEKENLKLRRDIVALRAADAQRQLLYTACTRSLRQEVTSIKATYSNEIAFMNISHESLLRYLDRMSTEKDFNNRAIKSLTAENIKLHARILMLEKEIKEGNPEELEIQRLKLVKVTEELVVMTSSKEVLIEEVKAVKVMTQDVIDKNDGLKVECIKLRDKIISTDLTCQDAITAHMISEGIYKKECTEAILEVERRNTRLMRDNFEYKEENGQLISEAISGINVNDFAKFVALRSEIQSLKARLKEAKRAAVTYQSFNYLADSSSINWVSNTGTNSGTNGGINSGSASCSGTSTPSALSTFDGSIRRIDPYHLAATLALMEKKKKDDDKSVRNDKERLDRSTDRHDKNDQNNRNNDRNHTKGKGDKGDKRDKMPDIYSTSSSDFIISGNSQRIGNSQIGNAQKSVKRAESERMLEGVHEEENGRTERGERNGGNERRNEFVEVVGGERRHSRTTKYNFTNPQVESFALSLIVPTVPYGAEHLDESDDEKAVRAYLKKMGSSTGSGLGSALGLGSGPGSGSGSGSLSGSAFSSSKRYRSALKGSTSPAGEELDDIIVRSLDSPMLRRIGGAGGVVMGPGGVVMGLIGGPGGPSVGLAGGSLGVSGVGSASSDSLQSALPGISKRVHGQPDKIGPIKTSFDKAIKEKEMEKERRRVAERERAGKGKEKPRSQELITEKSYHSDISEKCERSVSVKSEVSGVSVRSDMNIRQEISEKSVKSVSSDSVRGLREGLRESVREVVEMDDSVGEGEDDYYFNRASQEAKDRAEGVSVGGVGMGSPFSSGKIVRNRLVI